MKKLILLIQLLLMSKILLSQYPIVNSFNTATIDGWTQSGQTFNAGWHNPEDLCFNLSGNYLDNQFYYFDSPVMDHSLCDSIKVSFNVSMDLRSGDQLSFLFNDGGWLGVAIPGSGSYFVNLPNTTNQYSFELNTNSNGSLNGRFCHIDYVITECYTNSLPIDLSYFSVEKNKECNHVEWVTQSEINNDYFLLEVSYDGYNWSNLQKINGSNNSSLNIYYKYDDYKIVTGYTYYRLTQVNFNGEKEVFPIKTVFREDNKKEIHAIYNLIGQYIGKELNKLDSEGIYIVRYTDGSTIKINKQ